MTVFIPCPCCAAEDAIGAYVLPPETATHDYPGCGLSVMWLDGAECECYGSGVVDQQKYRDAIDRAVREKWEADQDTRYDYAERD